MSVVGMILAGAAVTYMWRAAGVIAAGKISADSQTLRFASCIAYAMVAALIARMILYPVGATAEIPVMFRLGALTVGLVVFAVLKRNVAAGAWSGAATVVMLNSSFGES